MRLVLFLSLGFLSLSITAQIEDYAIEQATGFSTPQRGIKNISIVDENIVWALAFDGSENNENVQEFTRTINGGDLWIPGTIDVDNTELGIGMITAVSETIAWVVAHPTVAGQVGGIFKTIDGGTTWFRQNTALFNLSGSFPNIVYFWDENKGFCQGDPVDGYYEIYTTTDGGDNWSRVPSANIPEPQSGEYAMTGKISVSGDTLWWISNHSRIFRSSDFGNYFEVFQTPLCDFDGPPCIYKFSFSDDNNGYLIDQYGIFWRSLDGGETWQIQFPDTGLIFGGHVFALPNTNVVLTSGHEDFLLGLSYSIDGGLNWGIIADIPITDIKLIKESEGSEYAGWFGSFNTSSTAGGIYKFINPSCVCSVPSKNNTCFSLYPNPVIDLFQIKSKKTISQIQIYTTLGQEVYTYQPNATSCKIDFSSFPKATYLVKITSEGVSETLKMIK